MTGILPLFASPIDEILAILPDLDEHFASPAGMIATAAQTFNFFYIETPKLEIIPLRRQPGSRLRDLVHQLAAVATRYTAFSPLMDAADAICVHVGGRMGRAFLGRLSPGSEIHGQIEQGIYERAVERFILPISGHLMISFGEGVRLLSPEMWYAVDAHVSHSMLAGDDGAIFLSVDTFPEQGEQPSGIDYDHLCPRAFG